MARKKQEEAPKGSPAWMATFSDLMNLLLCFFVLLFSMSSVDQQKFQEIAASLAASFSIFSDGGSSLSEGVLVNSGVSQLNQLAEYYNNMGLNSEGTTTNYSNALDILEQQQTAASEAMAEHISEELSEGIGEIRVEVVASKQYVAINLRSGVLFDSGSATLKKDSYDILTLVSGILEEYSGYTIQIIGHTDNIPTDKRYFEDNMILSMHRAYSVYRYFVDVCHLDDENLVSIGRGESAPVASNDTEEGRNQNRRVEIRIYNELSGS